MTLFRQPALLILLLATVENVEAAKSIQLSLDKYVALGLKPRFIGLRGGSAFVEVQVLQTNISRETASAKRFSIPHNSYFDVISNLHLDPSRDRIDEWQKVYPCQRHGIASPDLQCSYSPKTLDSFVSYTKIQRCSRRRDRFSSLHV